MPPGVRGALAAVAALALPAAAGCGFTTVTADGTCADFAAAPAEDQQAVAAELAHAAFGRPAGEIDDDVAYLELATYCSDQAPSARLAAAFHVQAG